MKFELMRQGGEFMRSLHPQGDWLLAGAALILVIVLMSLRGKGGK